MLAPLGLRLIHKIGNSVQFLTSTHGLPTRLCLLCSFSIAFRLLLFVLYSQFMVVKELVLLEFYQCPEAELINVSYNYHRIVPLSNFTNSVIQISMNLANYHYEILLTSYKNLLIILFNFSSNQSLETIINKCKVLKVQPKFIYLPSSQDIFLGKAYSSYNFHPHNSGIFLKYKNGYLFSCTLKLI